MSFRSHSRGLDVLGGGEVRRIQAHNTQVFTANMMSGDESTPVRDEDEPAFLLQVGADVTVLGPSKKSKRGVSYAPVSVEGRDGVFWVRESALGSRASYDKPAVARASQTPPPRDEGRPWWHYALAGLFAVSLGGVTYYTLSRHGGRGRRVVHA